MTTTVNIHEAKTHLSRLLVRVESGERIIIAKAGKPIAELAPIKKPDLVFGSMKGEIEYAEDAFLAPDRETLAMFDDDLGIDVPR
ncbi:MAG: prevent-host-death protein [Aeromicrobium sp.]|nr:prevent-host-death protein [Aeromicrobium sp.]